VWLPFDSHLCFEAYHSYRPSQAPSHISVLCRHGRVSSGSHLQQIAREFSDLNQAREGKYIRKWRYTWHSYTILESALSFSLATGPNLSCKRFEKPSWHGAPETPWRWEETIVWSKATKNISARTTEAGKNVWLILESVVYPRNLHIVIFDEEYRKLEEKLLAPLHVLRVCKFTV
jgi:hypothetical protein